jgi:apolipoprotein N-acyltransferase
VYAALAAFAAGAASVLAMAPFFMAPLLFVTLPMLLWLAERAQVQPGIPNLRTWHRTFWPGWWFGFGYFLLGLFWIGEAFLVEAEHFLWALPFAVTLLPAGLAIFFGFATAVATAISRPGMPRVLALALSLSAAEWLRGHILTGFPWNTLGYALTMPLVLMQSVSLIGIYGLTLMTVIVFAAPGVLLAASAGRAELARAGRQLLAVCVVPVLVMVAYGTIRLALMPDTMVADVRLRVVQPSIPQREKQMAEHQRRIFFDHVDLSKRLPDGAPDDLAGATHVIWPEAAMPFRPLQSPEALQFIGAMLPPGKHLLAGALRTADLAAGGRDVRNSLIAFGNGGDVTAIYDKIHLVPFGEYLPVRWLLEAIGFEEVTRQRGGFGIGPAPRPLLRIPGLPAIGPLICYEAIFPGVVVQGTERPGLLVNITNDGWFGNTTGPQQHLHQARLRAVEEGIPLVRAANNGISAMIAPSGRILAQLPLNVRGTFDVGLPKSVAMPLYARLGDAVFVVMWGLVAALLAWQMFRPDRNG